MQTMETEVKQLRDRLSKDSHNSHLPPSSDRFVKKTKSLRRPSGKKSGGQVGHEGNTLYQVKDPDEIIVHAVTTCLTCQHDLSTLPAQAIERRQEVDIPPRRVVVREHQAEQIDYALLIVTRFRQELARSNGDVPRALHKTMGTAGRAVIFSGLTVSVSLLGLLFFPEMFMRSLGLGAISAVVLAMLCALTLLPAILALLGSRINLLSFRKSPRQPQYPSGRQAQQRAWTRIAETVMRWPVPIIIVVIAFLLTLGYPFLNVSFYTAGSDPTVLPASAPARIVSDRLTRDFPQQGASQVTIAVTTSGDMLSAPNLARLDAYVQQVKGLPGVVGVDSLVTVNPTISLPQYQWLYAHPEALNPLLTSVVQQLAQGPYTKVTVFMQPADLAPDAENLVRQIRTLTPPQGLTFAVDGPTARQIDLFANIQAMIPPALATIAAAIFVLLFLMTGSILVPLKTVVINLLSLTATFGALVWIFQEGHFQNLLNFQASGHIDGTQPVSIFAIAFGLSTDYEVFLLSRIKEEYDATGDNRRAVSSGLQQTGGLITSAALLLAVVLGASTLSHIIFIQEIGVGLAIAVIMSELFYINRAKLLIKTNGVTLSREMTEVDYSIDYSLSIATREDAIQLLQHMPNESPILILRDIHAWADPIIKQLVSHILHLTPLELVDTITPDLSQLMHQQLQSSLSDYGITLDGVQVLVTPRNERSSVSPSFEEKSRNISALLSLKDLEAISIKQENPMIEEQKEIFVISQLIHFERHWRDTGQWDKMRDAYHPESRVRIPWFQGNGIDFVEASKKLYHAVPSKHRLSPTLVRVHGNRALAETSTMIEARGRLGEIEVDMTTSCRLLNKVRRDDGVWRLASLDAIYEKDTIALVNPSDSLTIDSKLLQTYRPSYRFLCFALQGLGRSVDQTLAGEDRPDLVAALYADAEAWLTNSAIGTK